MASIGNYFLAQQLATLESEVETHRNLWEQDRGTLERWYRSCFGSVAAHTSLINRKDWVNQALFIIANNEVNLDPTAKYLQSKLSNLKDFGARAGMNAEQLTKCEELIQRVIRAAEPLTQVLYDWKQKLAPPGPVWEILFVGFSRDALYQRLGMEEEISGLPDGDASLNFRPDVC